MILAGDEHGRTQLGNNNAYCQDNEISWINWDVDDSGKSLLEFVRQVVSIRHTYSAFHRNLFLSGEYNEDLQSKDVTWIHPLGKEMMDEAWSDSSMHCFGMMLDGRARSWGVRQRGRDAVVILVINANCEGIQFVMPIVPNGDEWVLLLDTSNPQMSAAARRRAGEEIRAPERSLLVFVASPHSS